MFTEQKSPEATLCYLGQKGLDDIFLAKCDYCIGSSAENDIRIVNENVSRYHAKILYDPSHQRFSAMDLNSTNGTYLDGRRLETYSPYPIKDEVRLQFSQVAFVFRYSVQENSSQSKQEHKTVPLPTENGEESFAATAELDKSKLAYLKNLVNVRNGQLFKGGRVHYEVISPLDSGGMGNIYKARRLDNDNVVVMKFLPNADMNNKKSILRFMNEARTLMDLKHPNIIQAFDFHHDPKHFYYVMEYVEGNNLENMIKKHRQIPISLATHVVLQIADALIYLEEKGILHRDIKPANIMWCQGEIAKLVDFGISRVGNLAFTTEGFVMGSPFYISPEQISGEPIDIRSEIYALGASYYHMITGALPFEFCSMGELLSRRMEMLPVRADKLSTQVPEKLALLLEKMMCPDLRSRIVSPRMLFNLLQEFL